MYYIFGQILVQLSMKLPFKFYLNDGINGKHFNYVLNIICFTFSILYLLFNILTDVKKLKVFSYISVSFDFCLTIFSILYFLYILNEMRSNIGEAGFGFIFLSISTLIFPYSIFSIIHKIKNINSSSQAR